MTGPSPEVFAPTFESPYGEHQGHAGDRFVVLEIVDANVIPVYRIRFADGAELDAAAEEVLPGWPGWEHHADHPLAGQPASQ